MNLSRGAQSQGSQNTEAQRQTKRGRRAPWARTKPIATPQRGLRYYPRRLAPRKPFRVRQPRLHGCHSGNKCNRDREVETNRRQQRLQYAANHSGIRFGEIGCISRIGNKKPEKNGSRENDCASALQEGRRPAPKSKQEVTQLRQFVSR